jgi:hypothetical protein
MGSRQSTLEVIIESLINCLHAIIEKMNVDENIVYITLYRHKAITHDTMFYGRCPTLRPLRLLVPGKRYKMDVHKGVDI